MSKDENQRQTGGPLAAALSQLGTAMATAATEFVAGILQSAGDRSVDVASRVLGGDSRGESGSDSILSVFSQYREALGDLAAVLPQVVQRASLEWRVEPGMRLIFRARKSVAAMPDAGEQGKAIAALFDAVDNGWIQVIGQKKVDILKDRERASWLAAKIATNRQKIRALRKAKKDTKNIETVVENMEAERAAIQPPEDWQHVFANAATLDAVKRAAVQGTTDALPDWATLKSRLEKIGKQFSSKGREKIPDILDQQKHSILADPVGGLAELRKSLNWMFDDDDLPHCYQLLETLDQSIGTDAVREILKRSGLFAKFVAALDGVQDSGVAVPDWEIPLRKTFAAIGYPLGAALTVLSQNTRERSEFVLLDHAHNRQFNIREGDVGFDTQSQREIEIYARREGRTYFTSQASTAPRILPHRIHDAAVGMAVWTVDRREVQAILDSDPHRPPVRLRAWDMGANRTPLALFVVHYRESDISEPRREDPAAGARTSTTDEHYELGVVCFVAPRNDPLAMGMMVLGKLPVSMKKAEEVGGKIWGYDKVHVRADKWDVRYRPDAMTCVLTLPGNLKLEVQLPRGGSRSSSRIPLLSYTTKFGQLHRNVLTRGGSGEALRVGGHGVEVRVTGPKEWWKREDVGGHCRSLLTLLYQFGIVRSESTKGRRAAYSVWTEHLQGEQGPPCLVPATFEREDE